MIRNPLPLSVFLTGVPDSPFITTELVICPCYGYNVGLPQ